MKTINSIKSIIISIGLVLLFSTGSMAQDKKNAVTEIKTSAVCGMCKDKIEQGMAFEKGIKDVVLDLDTKIATIRYNPSKTTPDEIRKKIAALGYDADTVPADKEAYEKLPACCKKGNEKH